MYIYIKRRSSFIQLPHDEKGASDDIRSTIEFPNTRSYISLGSRLFSQIFNFSHGEKASEMAKKYLYDR